MFCALHGFLAATALLVANPSASCCIPPVHVYAPPCISLVGSNAGVPASLGRFEVRVTDFANNPLNDWAVAVDLSQCGDLHLCPDQRDPGIVVDCAARTALARTNPLGIATFTLLGGSRDNHFEGGPSTIGARGKIYLSTYPTYGVDVTVNAYDLDGSVGVGANDLGYWLTDFGTGVPWARSDYDGNGSVGANDLSLWLHAFGDQGMLESCATRCP